MDKSDAPGVDIQQAGGAFQRLTLAIVIFAGALGAVALLGMLSLAVILAQVVALVLLGFAPIALIIGIFPRGGHEFFRNWLLKLATAIFIKALYSLVIAVVIAVSAALAAATESLGFLFAFALQGIFFWAIFLYRRQITARLVAATTGAAQDDRHPRMTVVQRGADAAMRPFGALIAVPGQRLGGARRQQESALAGDSPTTKGAPGSARDDHDSPRVHAAAGAGSEPDADAGSSTPDGGSTRGTPIAAARRGGRSGEDRPAALTAPASGDRQAAQDARDRDGGAGNGRVSAHEPAAGDQRDGPRVVRVASGTAQSHSGGRSAAAVKGPGSPSGAAVDASPRASHEDVMRRAHELRRRAGEDRDHPDRAA